MYTLAAIFNAIDSVRFFELSPFLYIATREWSPLNLDFDLVDLGELTNSLKNGLLWELCRCA